MKRQNLNTRTLSFEHSKDTNLLAAFSCGIESIDNFYWLKPFYDAVEITYLAVDVNKQHSHIGSFIIEHIISEIAESELDCDFVAVRALKCQNYTAVPFYGKCGFFAAEEEEPNRNLFMYRVIMR
ncbi:MAG: GNAT family N-acetyltransferase [Bacteroidaceae bacterium]|nr:GNAT family N-acetyltransferase [Bacteroidaceae bacterium]